MANTMLIGQCERLTDGRGQAVSARCVDEPGVGSIVLTNGESGTCFQHQADGRWHRAGGDRNRRCCVNWDWIINRRNVLLVWEGGRR